MQDLRLVNRLQNYWDIVRRGKDMPDYAQLNHASIDDMWINCMTLEVSHNQGGDCYLYRHMGADLVKMFGRDLTGMMLDPHASHYPYNIILGQLETVMKERRFVIQENQFVSEKGKTVKYRACFMPFGNAAKGVTHIVVGYSAREF